MSRSVSGSSRAPYPRAQTLAAVQGRRVGHHLPLELVVSEPIADLDLDWQHRVRRGVRVLRHRGFGSPRR